MHLYKVTSLCLLEFTMISEKHLFGETQKDSEQPKVRSQQVSF